MITLRGYGYTVNDPGLDVRNPHLHFSCAVIDGEPSLATSNDATSRSCEVQPNQTSEAGASTGQLHIPVAF